MNGQLCPKLWIGVWFRPRRTLIIFHYVAEVVAAGVMRLAHAHRVVREVHIAVVAYFVHQKSAGRSETYSEVVVVDIRGALSHCHVRVETASHAHQKPGELGLDMEPTKEFTDCQ